MFGDHKLSKTTLKYALISEYDVNFYDVNTSSFSRKETHARRVSYAAYLCTTLLCIYLYQKFVRSLVIFWHFKVWIFQKWKYSQYINLQTINNKHIRNMADVYQIHFQKLFKCSATRLDEVCSRKLDKYHLFWSWHLTRTKSEFVDPSLLGICYAMDVTVFNTHRHTINYNSYSIYASLLKFLTASRGMFVLSLA